MPKFPAKAYLQKPHRGVGPHAKPRQMAPLKAGAHLKQRDHSGFGDHKSYNGGRVGNERFHVKPAAVPREAGHYHPSSTRNQTRGLLGDVKETRYHNREKYTERELGSHTGKAPRGDTNIRRGPQGNSKGSAPPGTGKVSGRKGSPTSHMGTAGRGGVGELTRMSSNRLSEDPSHDWFEGLGAK